MNKAVITMMAIAGCSAVFAGINDLVITFSTPGPDRYADGTTVLDGECYALVHTPADKTFSGFAADGSVIDPSTGKLVLCAPVAKGGHCPLIAFEVDGVEAANEYPSGTWGVYLLDTRKFGENGTAVPSGTDAGKPTTVNASGMVAYGKVSKQVGGRFAAVAPVTASGITAVPEGTPKPRITDIKVIDGMVYVTVRDTVPYVNYTLKEGVTPSSITAAPDQGARAGEAGKEIILVTPKKGDSGFFGVGRR